MLQDTNNYDEMNQGIDRITQILQRQSAPMAGAPVMPQASQLPVNILNAIASSSYDYGHGGQNFMAGVQNYQNMQQDNELNQQKTLLSAYEQKLKMGDAQTKALDDRIAMFTGGDEDGKAMFLTALHNDPEPIDPTNSYQVMTKLAAIKKQTGYESPDLQLAKEKQKADLMQTRAKINYYNNKGNSMGGVATIDPETGEVIQPTQQNGFGFDTSNIPQTVFNKMSNEDSKRRQADISNMPIASNILRSLDQLEPNLEKFHTGGMMPETRAATGRFFDTEAGTAAGNIEKGTNDLATELNKFQYVPGMRGSVLGLQTILGSKPGVTQPKQTNKNIISSLRAKVTDYQLTGELAQQYRELNPRKITDENTYKLDNALKDIYPLETVDPKTGVVVFNKDNAELIRQAIPEAIQNPQKYFQLAREAKSGGGKPKFSPDQIRAELERRKALKAGGK